MRLKKLRGSGGFIMANVTDEQQQKGNLGGPDLFLAPVGRLDSDKISKFFCNTCEKDYVSFMELLVYYYSRERTPILQSIWKVTHYLCMFCLIDVYVSHSFPPLSFHLSTGLTVEILLLCIWTRGGQTKSHRLFNCFCK